MNMYLKRNDYLIVFFLILVFILPYFYKIEINKYINNMFYKNIETLNSNIEEKLNLYTDIISLNEQIIDNKNVELENLFIITEIEKISNSKMIFNTENYVLTSIITFGDNIKKARINNKFYNENEVIDGIKIESILKNSVILNFNNEKKEIFIIKNRIKY